MLIHDSFAKLDRYGHICLRRIVPDNELQQILSELIKFANPYLHQPQSLAELEENVSSYGKGWTFQENLWRSSSRLRNFFLKGTLAQIATHLFSHKTQYHGKIGLLRDQTYFKNPGSEFTPWHQDGTFIPMPSIRSFTFWLPFTTIDASMSPMHYVDMSHRYCWLGAQDNTKSNNKLATVDDFNSTLRNLKNLGKKVTAYDDMEPGDILIHDTWTLHGSPVHTGKKPRLAIVVVYYAVEGCVDQVPSIRLHNPSDTAQAQSLRYLNMMDLFPSLNGKDLRGTNPRTPTLLCKHIKGDRLP